MSDRQEKIRKIANILNKRGMDCCRCMNCKTCALAEKILDAMEIKGLVLLKDITPGSVKT